MNVNQLLERKLLLPLLPKEKKHHNDEQQPGEENKLNLNQNDFELIFLKT